MTVSRLTQARIKGRRVRVQQGPQHPLPDEARASIKGDDLSCPRRGVQKMMSNETYQDRGFCVALTIQPSSA